MLTLDEWLKIYEDIAKRLRLSPIEDERAAEMLNVLIRNRGLEPSQIKPLIIGKHAIIVGAGPSVIEDLEGLKRIKRENLVFITCDGATKAFMEVFETHPDIIVTDLDGYLKEQVLCSKSGSIAIVHAHGDNKTEIATYVPKLEKVMGTTQVKPKEKVFNFGGFTDGDRAVYIAGYFKPKSITLVGMNLEEEVGKFSKPIIFDRTKKIQKLKIAKELLELFAKKNIEKGNEIQLFNLTNGGVEIEGFKRINIKEFIKIVYS